MIQILGLRDYKQGTVTKKRETFFNKGWRFTSVEEVFDADKLNALLTQIPDEEKYNLYFTVADCFEESGRKLKEQWAIPFDIDALYLKEGEELQTAELAARAAADAIGVPYEEMAVVFSGHGVQFFILLSKPIISDDYFEATRDGYVLLCKRIQNKLTEQSIQGTVDTSVWSKGRLMRLPNTLNKKPDKVDRVARILNGTMVARHFDIIEESGVQSTEVPEQISDMVLKNYPKPDTKAVGESCEFLKFCRTNPNDVTEPQWYAMTSITARLDNGRDLTHEYSSGYGKYNHYETENKIDQALAASGPRTCKNIDSIWGGCTGCEYYGKVTSPIMIKGEDYIASADFGYRVRKKDKEGNIRAGPPAYMDLIKLFSQEHPYQVIKDSNQVIIFNGKHWEFFLDTELFQWCMSRVRHEPNSGEMLEFTKQLKAFNLTSMDTLFAQKERRMNFKNCVLDLRTLEATTHAPEYGFFNVLPFDYDPRATAPKWEQFLLDIMGNDPEMAELLKEYGGYCISGDECWLQRAALLIGDGANGKSVFMEILGEVVGRDARSAVPMQDIEKATSRYNMLNKLFNYSEETSINALADSSTFKTLVAGGEISVRKLYVNEFEVVNRTKIIMAANNMPTSQDKSHGFLRRLTIIPFEVRFEPDSLKHDYFIKDKLKTELPGICNSLMKAYANLRIRGRLTGSVKTDMALIEYKSATDTVLMFKQDHIEYVNSDSFVRVSEVYEHYRAMCAMKGMRPQNEMQFGSQIRRIDPSFKDRRERIRIGDGSRVYIYRGIKLNKEF